jgi:Glyoxalase-like domain
MANRWVGVTIDCVDVERVAGFWSALLDRPQGPSQPGWVYLGQPGDPRPRLAFQPVSTSANPVTRGPASSSSPLPSRNTARYPCTATSQSTTSTRQSPRSSPSARFTRERHDHDKGAVVVMAEPEEHEFCLVQYP